MTGGAAHAGQAAYTPLSLRFYDAFVLGFSSRFLWRCPSRYVADLYARHASANHLDVGVGTGYFLDRNVFPSAAPRIGLLDLNPHSLDHTARRIARYRPEQYRANVLVPLDIDAPPFDSIGLGYLLHCLPGAMAEKAIAFDHLAAVANPGAVFFGATILGQGVRHNGAGRLMMTLYNRRGIFANEADDFAALETSLHHRFEQVTLRLVGTVALFTARGTRPTE